MTSADDAKRNQRQSALDLSQGDEIIILFTMGTDASEITGQKLTERHYHFCAEFRETLTDGARCELKTDYICRASFGTTENACQIEAIWVRTCASKIEEHRHATHQTVRPVHGRVGERLRKRVDKQKNRLAMRSPPSGLNSYLGEHLGVLLDVALLAAGGAGLLAHGEHQLAGLAVHVQHAHAHLCTFGRRSRLRTTRIGVLFHYKQAPELGGGEGVENSNKYQHLLAGQGPKLEVFTYGIYVYAHQTLCMLMIVSYHVALLDVVVAVCHELVGQLGDVHEPVHLRFFVFLADIDVGQEKTDVSACSLVDRTKTGVCRVRGHYLFAGPKCSVLPYLKMLL